MVAATQASSTKILIVEDDQFLRDFYQELLQTEGYQVDTAADGEIASSKIYEGGYSLVLLDIMLPKKRRFAHTARQQKKFAQTPQRSDCDVDQFRSRRCHQSLF